MCMFSTSLTNKCECVAIGEDERDNKPRPKVGIYCFGRLRMVPQNQTGRRGAGHCGSDDSIQHQTNTLSISLTSDLSPNGLTIVLPDSVRIISCQVLMY